MSREVIAPNGSETGWGAVSTPVDPFCLYQPENSMPWPAPLATTVLRGWSTPWMRRSAPWRNCMVPTAVSMPGIWSAVTVGIASLCTVGVVCLRKGSTPEERGRGEVAIEVDEAAILHALGSAITERRTELGMSQRGLATEAGLDRVFLRGIEDGTRKATVITLIRLATALDTTAADLLANC